jgi:hypothetical protein
VSLESLVLSASLACDPVEVVLRKVGERSGTSLPREVLPPQIGVLRSRSVLSAHSSNYRPGVLLEVVTAAIARTKSA